MKREFSLYLDLVRFISAVMVVIYHSNLRMVITEKLPASDHGHSAVIVFFVLSGYVIAYITSAKERTPLEYWSSRIARIYSLALPAVLVTPLIDIWGESMAPVFYIDKTTHDFWWLRILTSLSFLNEVWHISIMSFSNVPYWSLCYEMWYYILFAIFMFTRGRQRIILALAAALAVGPKILLLAPIWILGVVLFRYERLYRLAERTGWLLFFSSFLLYALFHHWKLTDVGSEAVRLMLGDHLHRELAFSKFFLTDYLLALIVAMNFIGFRVVAHRFHEPMLMVERPVRWLSSYTLSLYILHQPLLLFYAAAFNGDPNGSLYYAQVMGATLFSVIIIGTFTEHKRRHFRQAIHGCMSRLLDKPLFRRSVLPAFVDERKSR